MTAGSGAAPAVVCMGEALVDFIAVESVADVGRAGTFVKAPGGAMANVAVGLARLGARSRFVGKRGSDPFGRFMQRVLAAEGVDTSYFIESKKYATGLVFVALDEQRRPSFIFFGDPSADMMLRADEVGPGALAGAGFLHLSTVSLVGEEARAASFKLVRLAQELNVRVSFDPNFRLHLWKDHDLLKALAYDVAAAASLVKLNREELLFMTGTDDPGRGARRLRELGADLAVVTLGPEGAYYSCAEGEGMTPGFAVKAADTTGAGDGFAAGLLAALSAEHVWPPGVALASRAARFANAAGAMVTLELGAMSSLPTRAQVESFLSGQGRTQT